MESQDTTKQHPDRFNLKTIAGVVQSFRNTARLSDLEFDKHKQWYPIEFKHDQLLYRARTMTQHFYAGQDKSELIIKLPNNGYLYKKVEEFQVQQKNITHCDNSTFFEPLGPVWSFVDTLFGDDQWKVRLFFSYEDERVYMKFSHDTRPQQIEITFEQGYPIEEFDESTWSKPTSRSTT